MAGNIKKVKVDKEKVYRELNKRGLTATQASLEMNFTHNYLSTALSNGELPKRTVRNELSRIREIFES